MRGFLLLCGAIGTIPISYELGHGDIWLWTVALYWPLSFLIAFLRAKSQKGVNLVRFALPIFLSTKSTNINHEWAKMYLDSFSAEPMAYYLSQGQRYHGWRWPDLEALDEVHCWTIFTMYWPCIAYLQLFGDIKATEPVIREWSDTTQEFLNAGLGQEPK